MSYIKLSVIFGLASVATLYTLGYALQFDSSIWYVPPTQILLFIAFLGFFGASALCGVVSKIISLD